MIKLKKLYLYYSEYRNEYSMDVTIGDKERELTFKLDNKHTRKTILPMLEAICDACNVAASELKRDVIAAVNSEDEDGTQKERVNER